MALEHFRIAWKAFKKNWKTLISGAFIALILLYMFIGIGFIPFLRPIQSVTQGEEILTESNIVLMATGTIIMLFGLFIYVIFLTAFIQLCNQALKKKAVLKTMFDEARYRWKPFLAVNILVMIISFFVYSPAILMFLLFIATENISFVFAGLLMYLVAMLLVLFFMFSQFSVVIDKVGAVTGVKRSVRFVRANYIETLKLIILVIILSLVISIALAFIPFGSMLSSIVL